ncbi:MAG: phospholipase D-like domain-containing protein, partial [Bdellovibrionota bacterium]
MNFGRLVLSLLLVGSFSASFAVADDRAPSLRVFFNHSPTESFTEPYRHITRSGTDFESELLKDISSAQHSVLVAVQELRLPNLAKLLVEKKRAGLDVRVVLENTYNIAFSTLSAEQIAALSDYDQGKYREFLLLADAVGNGDGVASVSEQLAADGVEILREAKVPLIDDTADGTKGSGLMHHKFVVIDDATTIVTTANFSTSDFFGDFASPASRGNANSLLVFASRDFAKLFQEEFGILWGNGSARSSRFGVKKPYRPAKRVTLEDGSVVTVQFSPFGKRIPFEQTSNGLIARTLDSAQSSIDFALFVFSEQKLVDAMDRPGLHVRGLVEPSFAYRYYSEMLDIMGLAMPGAKCKFEANNKPWTHPSQEVGIPRLPEGDKLHHKFGVVDGTHTIVGSHNWSAAANQQNDETLLVIDSAAIGARYEDEFARLNEGAILGPKPWLLEK